MESDNKRTKMSKGEIKHKILKEEIGIRFKKFRQALKKTQVELADELEFNRASISEIERGKMFPGLLFLNKLHHQYNLNINFLFSEDEEMFLSPGKNTELPILFWHLKENDPRFEQYVELISLMRIRFIEQIIFGKLQEIKTIAKEEINSFFDGK